MKTIKLYMDTKENYFVKENDFRQYYEDLKDECEKFNGGVYEFQTFDEFKRYQVDSGQFKEITATLSDGRHAYPYYYFMDEYCEVMTIMELYGIWHTSAEEWRYQNTFADLLNNPQVDRNGVDFYGFYL